MARAIVVGAGPAGTSLAYLLADRGVETTLVERQRDFAREFRGELLMPSGVDALEQMGLGPALRAAPHVAPGALDVYLRGRRVLHLEVDAALVGPSPPLAVSQPGLLEAIVAEASKRPCFRLLRGASVREVRREGERVVGVRVATDEGERDLLADLVVGADGRASVVRRGGGFEATERAVPMDIVWCKLPLLPGLRGARGYLGSGHLLIAYRSWDDRMQMAWAIVKGTFGELRRRGIEEWVEEMAHHVTPDLAAHLRAHKRELTHPFLLDAVSDRVTRWSAPGVLLIGDAAHTSSPVGGQGLNLALRDAIVAANQLVPTLRAGASPERLDDACGAIERERLPEIAAVQRLQSFPPRVALQRGWWGEPARWLVALALQSGLARRLAARQARLFAFGLAPVRLEV